MATNRLLLLLAVLSASFSLTAQSYNYAYLVEFTDKVNSSFSTDNPIEFLSERAINRRLKNNIEITEQDFPVNKDYTNAVLELNCKLHVTSRWFNSAVFHTNESDFEEQVLRLSFVEKVSLVFIASSKSTSLNNKWEADSDTLIYGSSFNQIAMCNAHNMHDSGYKGEDIHIAVMDGGFDKVNELSGFDSLYQNKQILAHWDFVEGNSDVFGYSTHGMKVLSTLAGNIPGEIVGTAPKAYYYLYRTEDVSTEFPIEEENWIAAAEVADSAGVDLFTTSLGYSTFNDESMNYTNADMDGKTTRITRGSEIAFSKGIVVVNSAGNEGDDAWRHITAPGDGENVLCVGAVDANEIIAPFSSRGPSADGRIKPDVVAKGARASILSVDDIVVQGNGTSYSCPIMAGMVACLWQALPDYSNEQVLNLVRSYGNQYTNPDMDYGYGLPDFNKLFFTLDSINYNKTGSNKIVKYYPNPFTNTFAIHLFVQNEQEVEIRISNSQGEMVRQQYESVESESYNHIQLRNVEELSVGAYVLTVITNEDPMSNKIIKY